MSETCTETLVSTCSTDHDERWTFLKLSDAVLVVVVELVDELLDCVVGDG